jgi:aminoglycoside phosphotransferase (APT) family kinase protein
MTDTHHDLRGLDLARFGTWFEQAVPDGTMGVLSARLIAGGRSNLTYEVFSEAGSWIVRRPPLGHVLATAHDMAREYRVMSALQDTEVPVPTTYAFCDDAAVLGAPFYVMERIVGSPYRYAAELEPLGPERARTISARLVDTLATLHDVDPATVGLADFGRPEGFLGRQVNRWKKQLDASHSRDLGAATELHARLAANIPPESAPGIVHGDYRLDNVLTDDHDRPAAVVDWEMATLGDPLTDLALLVLYRRLGSLMPDNVVTTAGAAPGFLTESELLDRYAGRSHRALSSFGFHLGLASFKLATIFEGIHYRYLHGQTVGSGFEDFGTLTEPLLDIGLSALRDYD